SSFSSIDLRLEDPLMGLFESFALEYSLYSGQLLLFAVLFGFGGGCFLGAGSFGRGGVRFGLSFSWFWFRRLSFLLNRLEISVLSLDFQTVFQEESKIQVCFFDKGLPWNSFPDFCRYLLPDLPDHRAVREGGLYTDVLEFIDITLDRVLIS